MRDLEKRVHSLEASQPSAGVKVVLLNVGETREQAFQRAGISPDEPNVLAIAQN